jgi:hypothetical protein
MKYKILEELTENEIELLFEGVSNYEKDWETISEWNEGEGRGVSYYEIIKANDLYVLRVQHYRFNDFGMPMYYFITLTDSSDLPSNETESILEYTLKN